MMREIKQHYPSIKMLANGNNKMSIITSVPQLSLLELFKDKQDAVPA